jgi:hypothetical protein
LPVTAWGAEPLQSEGEARPLDVELEAAASGPGAEHLGPALRLPAPPEHEGGPPGPGRHGLHALGPDPLHDAQAFAEPRERLEEPIERAVGDELIAQAQRGDDPLADVAEFTAGLDDLEILARVRPGATTLHAHEHGAIIATASRNAKKTTRGAPARGTTFRVGDRLNRRKSASSRKRLFHCCRK